MKKFKFLSDIGSLKVCLDINTKSEILISAGGDGEHECYVFDDPDEFYESVKGLKYYSLMSITTSGTLKNYDCSKELEPEDLLICADFIDFYKDEHGRIYVIGW